MAIRPVSYDPTGGVTVAHDELGHTGAVAFADVRFGQSSDGGTDVDVLSVGCPVCGAASFHPVTGGGDPLRVQLLFWRTWRRRAALGALGIPAGERTSLGVKARLRQRVIDRGGLLRWRLDPVGAEDDPVDQLG